jgi:hypothetical protein
METEREGTPEYISALMERELRGRHHHFDEVILEDGKHIVEQIMESLTRNNFSDPQLGHVGRVTVLNKTDRVRRREKIVERMI